MRPEQGFIKNMLESVSVPHLVHAVDLSMMSEAEIAMLGHSPEVAEEFEDLNGRLIREAMMNAARREQHATLVTHANLEELEVTGSALGLLDYAANQNGFQTERDSHTLEGLGKLLGFRIFWGPDAKSNYAEDYGVGAGSFTQDFMDHHMFGKSAVSKTA
ncbi:MAG: hypothetical protein WDN66_05505 [Candidatus Saccharibacteria bacterium]